MYVVIFTAQLKQRDAAYEQTAATLRDTALTQFNCVAFRAVTEGQQEIALSYWHCEADIIAWRQAAEHVVAQAYGQSHWYESYKVEIAKVERAYEG